MCNPSVSRDSICSSSIVYCHVDINVCACLCAAGYGVDVPKITVDIFSRLFFITAGSVVFLEGRGGGAFQSCPFIPNTLYFKS